MLESNWPYLFVIILGMYVFMRLIESNKSEVYNEAMKEVEKLYNRLEGDAKDYTFYSTGHPYTWTEYDKGELESRLINACKTHVWPAFFYQYSKPKYVVEIDEKNKHIFWVIGKSEFDFNSLKIYEGNGRYRDINS